MPASRSIHKEVPVNPRWPIDRREKKFPEEDGMDGVSQPSARDVPSGCPAGSANRATVCSENNCVPVGVTPFARMHAAIRRISSAQENRPAWPATPSITEAFSSCTSPWMMRCRKLRSSSVGGIDRRSFSSGQKRAVLMPSGAKTSRSQNESSRSPVIFSTQMSQDHESDV